MRSDAVIVSPRTPQCSFKPSHPGYSAPMAGTKRDLYDRARELEIEGRSGMTKDELEEAIEKLDSTPKHRLREPNGQWFHDHLLSVILLFLFILSILGQFYFQYRHEADEAIQHGQSPPPMMSSEFWQSFLASVFENWQSEFLQILTFVILTTYFIHRHSHESADESDEMAADIRAIKQKLDA